MLVEILNPETDNIKPQIEKLAARFVEQLRRKKEVEGVVFLGGLGIRNFLDQHSDVDIAVFVDCEGDVPKKLPEWLPQFEFQLKLSAPIGEVKEIEFNIHQQILSVEQERDWDEGKKEAYSRGNVIYDKQGKVTKFLQEKLRYSEEERRRRLIEIMAQFPPYSEINPRRQVDRGFIHNGHDLLNQTGEMIVEVLFLFNRRYRPHKKWRMETSFHLPWTPEGYEFYLKEAMLIESYSAKDIERRITCFKSIIIPLREKLIESGDIPEAPYEYACRHLWGRQLLDKPFSTRIRELLANRNLGFDPEKLRFLAGYLNYRLVSSSEEFLDLAEKDGYLREILSEEEINQASGIVRIEQV